MIGRTCIIALAVVSIQLQPGAAVRQRPSERWLTAWGSSQNGLGMTAVTNATVRMIYEPFNCGDGIHPSPRGYFEMGKAVPLDLFR